MCLSFFRRCRPSVSLFALGYDPGTGLGWSLSQLLNRRCKECWWVGQLLHSIRVSLLAFLLCEMKLDQLLEDQLLGS